MKFWLSEEEQKAIFMEPVYSRAVTIRPRGPEQVVKLLRSTEELRQDLVQLSLPLGDVFAAERISGTISSLD